MTPKDEQQLLEAMERWAQQLDESTRLTKESTLRMNILTGLMVVVATMAFIRLGQLLGWWL